MSRIPLYLKKGQVVCADCGAVNANLQRDVYMGDTFSATMFLPGEWEAGEAFDCRKCGLPLLENGLFRRVVYPNDPEDIASLRRLSVSQRFLLASIADALYDVPARTKHEQWVFDQITTYLSDEADNAIERARGVTSGRRRPDQPS